MMPNREEEIFSAALRIEDPAERQRYLAEVCGEDSSLREQILALLDAEGASQDFFRSADRAADERPEVAAACAIIEERVGRYRILEQIGEGGFAAVYMAEQEEPVRRRVALKIIKPGMDTRQVLARFEAERQALAMMEHPHIAKVFDAGTTRDRRPYFVMELVRGLPLTTFCDERELTQEERLNLFTEICEAVQHAHQKGVIHRDLKPSNILVTLEGNRAVPKVIDFGVAKAMGEPLTEKTIATRFHQFIGTPQYMSPEQVEMSNLGVDTRADIYSLGVLVYELLVGQTPIEPRRVAQAGMLEVRRMILDERPVNPSTRVGTLKPDELTTTASRRRCAPDKMGSLLRGDLDRIVMKAIDKDRDQRYESAGAMAEDIRRFLRHEPVLAVPPSARYRFGRFVRRNRVAVAAGSIATLGMVVGLVLSLVGLSHAHRDKVRAEHEALNAREQAATVGTVLEFLDEELFGQIDPFRSSAARPVVRDLKLLTAIQLATAEIDKRFRDRPLVEAQLRLTLARAFRRLGELGSAESHLRRVFEIYGSQSGPDDLKPLDARQEQAWLLIDQSKYDEAARLAAEILDQCRLSLGPDHDRTLEAMNCLATAYHLGSRDLEALPLFQEVLRSARGSSMTHTYAALAAMDGLAGVYYEFGNFTEHDRYTYEVYDFALERLGSDHPLTLRAALDVVNLNRLGSRALRDSEQLAEKTLKRSRMVLGENHPTTIALLSERTLFDDAKGLNILPALSNLVQIARNAFGENDPKAIRQLMLLGYILRFEDYLSQAEECLEQAMHRLHAVEGPDTLNGRRVMRWLSEVHLAQDQYPSAAHLRGRELEACRRLMGMESPWTQAQFYALANIHARQAHWESASQLYHEFLPFAPKDYGNDAGFPAGAAWTSHAAGLVAAALADKPDRVRTIGGLALDRFGDTENAEVACEVSRALLLVPEAVVVTNKTFALANLALEHLEDPMKQALLAGMLAYRQRDWHSAAAELATFASRRLGNHLDRPTSPLRGNDSRFRFAGNPDAPIACLAGCFLAMAQHRIGLTDQAEQTLMIATDRLKSAVRSGDLGKTTQYPDEEWVPLGAAILAAREAEQVVRGLGRTAFVDDAYLVLARKNWEPVKESIAQANRWARQREWERARDTFLQTMQGEAFDWDGAAHDGDELVTKLAAVLVLTGELELYMDLCERLVENGFVSQTAYVKPLLLSPVPFSSELKTKALSMARWQAQQNARNPPAEPVRWYDLLILGLAEFRNQHTEEALTKFREAQNAYDLRHAGTAFAWAALAEWQLGRHADAKQSLARARQIFDEVLEGSHGDLGRQWIQTAIFEIALREAKQVIGDSTPGRSANGANPRQ